MERFFVLAAELAEQKLDVLSFGPGCAPWPAIVSDNDNPDVAAKCPDRVGTKAGREPWRPGGNSTGLLNMAVELTRKRLELAKVDDQRPVARGDCL